MECYHSLLLLLSLCCAWVIAQGRVSPTTLSSTKRFHFNVEWKMVTRLCNTKPLLTVNGEYPGPNIMVQEGDDVEIVVTNGVAMNTTIHWLAFLSSH
ncbi:hypothetical protein MRB53_020155 [Persea americana]|uniref:Uncharacterized protein n=1 Tax=Persea americana TaxID=3435 RepID=A0ACC2L1F1_PERAE|nr:hypothetical protein MRB53_020155 [Persea americana]